MLTISRFKIIAINLLIIIAGSSFSQSTIIYTKGQQIKVIVKAVSEKSLFTTSGTYQFLEMDSIDTDDSDIRKKFLTANNLEEKSEFKTLNENFIDGLPINESGRMVLSEVVECDATKDQLYSRSKVFFAEFFKSAQDVIQLDDKETGTVLGKGFSNINIGLGITRMYFTIKIQAKEKRYRYSIENIYYQGYSLSNLPEIPAERMYLKKEYYKKNGSPKLYNLKYKQGTLIGLKLIKDAIKSEMAKASQNKENDW